MSFLSNPIVEFFFTFLASFGQMAAMAMLLKNWMPLLKRVIVSFLIVTGYLYVWVERVGKNVEVFRSRWLPCLIFSLAIGLLIAYKDKKDLKKMAREEEEQNKKDLKKKNRKKKDKAVE